MADEGWQLLASAPDSGRPILFGWQDGWIAVGWWTTQEQWPLGWWWHGCEETEYPPELPTHWRELPERCPRIEV